MKDKYYDYLKLRQQIFYEQEKEKLSYFESPSIFFKNVAKQKGKVLYLYRKEKKKITEKVEVLSCEINNLPKLEGKYYLLLDQNLFDLKDNAKIKKANEIITQYESGKEVKNPFKFTDVYSKEKCKEWSKVFKKVSSIKKHLFIPIGFLPRKDTVPSKTSEIEALFQALFIEDKEKRYQFIYDFVCQELDSEFSKRHLCGFHHNVCYSKNELKIKGKKLPLIYGCCYTKGRVCPYLKENGCTIQCLPCKLFTCRYLRKRGIKYRAKDQLLLKTFFSPKQLRILEDKIYTSKEEIFDLLLNKKVNDTKRKTTN